MAAAAGAAPGAAPAVAHGRTREIKVSNPWDGANYPFSTFRANVFLQLRAQDIPAELRTTVVGPVVSGAAAATYGVFMAGHINAVGALDPAGADINGLMNVFETVFGDPMQGRTARIELKSLRLVGSASAENLRAYHANFLTTAARVVPAMTNLDLAFQFEEGLPISLRKEVAKVPRAIDNNATIAIVFEEAMRVVSLWEMASGRWTTSPGADAGFRGGGGRRDGGHRNGGDGAQGRGTFSSTNRSPQHAHGGGHGVPGHGTASGGYKGGSTPVSSGQRFEGRCFNCGKEGHRKSECKAPPRVDGAAASAAQTGRAPSGATHARPAGTHALEISHPRETDEVAPMFVVTGDVLGLPARASMRSMVDTGAQISLLSRAKVKAMRAPTVKGPARTISTLAGTLTTDDSVTLVVRFGERVLTHNFVVVEQTLTGAFEAILGADLLQKHRIVVDIANGRLVFPETAQVTVSGERVTVDGIHSTANLHCLVVEAEQTVVGKSGLASTPEYAVEIGTDALVTLVSGVGTPSNDLSVGDDNPPPLVPVKFHHEVHMMSVESDFDAPDIDGLTEYDQVQLVDVLEVKEVIKNWPLVSDILLEFLDVLAVDLNRLRTPADVPPIHLRLSSENVNPVHLPPFRMPIAQQQLLKREIDRLLEAGIIVPSESPWAARTFVVPKRNGELRVVTDYRPLNDLLERVSIPVPLISDILDALSFDSAALCFLDLFDLKGAYWQIPLALSSQAMTAFTTPFGHFEYTRMPMGVSSAPGLFNQVIRSVFADLPWVVTYFDDVYKGAGDLPTCRSRTRQFLQRCREKGLIVGVKKSQFAQKWIVALGYRISSAGLEPDPERVESLLRVGAVAPRSVRQLQRLLGMVQYYSRFIPHMAQVCVPLYALLRRDVPFVWSTECAEAQQTLVRALASDPIVRLPDPTLPYLLYTDASGLACGAVLCQRGLDGEERVVYWASRVLNKYEQHYGVTEQECLAVVWAIKLFRVYLWGTQFTVITDHAALKWLFSIREPVGRLSRWAIYLQGYQFAIEHRPGKDHVNADFMSRPFELENQAEDSAAASRDAIVLAEVHPIMTRGRAARQLAEQLETVDPAIVARLSRDLTQAYAEPQRPRTEDDVPLQLDPTPFGPAPGPAQQPVAPSELVADASDRLVHVVDPTEDALLLHFVQHGRHATGISRSRIKRIERSARDLSWRDGSLWHRSRDGVWCAVPPVSDRLRLAERAHRQGHFQVESTLERLKNTEKLWWPEMITVVTAIVYSCAACARARVNKSLFHPPAKSIESTGVWDLVTMDTQWGLPESGDGYKGVLVLIDHLSKFPFVYPLKSKEAGEIAGRLWDFISVFGPPKSLLSDNGTEFINSLVDELCVLHGVDRLVTAPYKPQTNGLVERFNGTLATGLRTLAMDNPSDWPRYLASFLWFYRTREHSTTGVAPYTLAFAREANTFCDSTGGGAVPAPDISARLAEIVRHSETVQDAIRREQREQAGQRRRTDERHRVLDLQDVVPGTKVYVRLGGRVIGKMVARYVGPYSVVRVDRAGNVVLKNASGVPLTRAVPLQRLKLTTSLDSAGGSGVGVGDGSDAVVVGPTATDFQLWDVEAILDSRVSTSGVIQYLVKWAGFAEAEATWEAEAQFVDLNPIYLYWEHMAEREGATRDEQGQEGVA